MDALREHYLQEIRDIRARIVELVLQRDNVVLTENPALEAEYLSVIGIHEIKLAEAEVAARRAKKKLAMCRACSAANEKIDVDAIDDVLNKEYQEWQDCDEEGQVIYGGEAKIAKAFGDEAYDEEKFKKLYRKLCKRLHPDTATGDDFDSTELLHAVLYDYKKGDMIAIVAYCDYLGEDSEDKLDEMSDSELSLYSERCRAREAVVVEQLSRLQDSFPQNIKENMKNQNWVNEMTDSLKANIKKFEDQKQSYELKLEELLAQAGGEE